MRKVLAASLALTTVLAAAPSRAQPNFPAIVQEYIGAVRKPPCRVCHANGQTGFGTVTTTFGVYMLRQGARAYDIDGLYKALESLVEFGNKSDKDRKETDLEVLKRGGDPNELNPVYPITEPEYGCGGATFAARSSVTWPASLLVVLGLALARRRAKR